MPEGAIFVGRPTGRGNPWIVGKTCLVPDAIVDCFAVVRDRQHAVDLYRALLANNPDYAKRALKGLAGRDLACWCRLDQPCHADVLLELANGPESSGPTGRGTR
jgi:hypothetical protein